MAVIRKRGKTWQAMVRLKGHAPVSATRPTKREAELWAQAEEATIRSGQRGKFPVKTLNQALDRYAEEVSTKKRNANFEELRIAALKRDFPDLCARQFADITPAHLAQWRDSRLKSVTKGTVQREANLYRNVWTVAIREWGWAEVSPWKQLRLPGNNPARQSTWGWRDIRTMCRRLGYVTGMAPRTKAQECAYLFLASLHTGLRASEVLSLTRASVDLDRRVIHLASHKTVERVGARKVPFSRRALKYIRPLVEKGISLSARTLSANFLKYRTQMQIEGLTFHDARATFATLMSRRVDALTLAKVLGHKDISLLSLVYYREAASDIAARL